MNTEEVKQIWVLTKLAEFFTPIQLKVEIDSETWMKTTRVLSKWTIDVCLCRQLLFRKPFNI